MEFAYNKQYHNSISMAPYEALYGRKCSSKVHWGKEGTEILEGPKIVQMTVDKINVIKSKLKEAQDHQKSYTDQHRREIEYQIGN